MNWALNPQRACNIHLESWWENGSWPQGFQTDEQWFCETCPLVRKQTAGNTEIGWQSRGNVDTTELHLRSRTNLLAGSVISMTLSIDPAAAWGTEMPSSIQFSFIMSEAGYTTLSEQHRWNPPSETTAVPMKCTTWCHTSRSTVPTWLISMETAAASRSRPCHVFKRLPARWWANHRPDVRTSYIVRHLQGLFTYYAYQKNTFALL